jgi:anti-sigma factor RsiW
LSCQETTGLIHGYLDGELDLVRNLDIEAHLRDCTACARRYENLRALKTALKDSAFRFAPSAEFEKRVRASIDREARIAGKRVAWSPRWLVGSFALVVLVAVIFALATFRRAPSTEDLVAQEVVSSHVRSLMAGHLTDVATSDQHTVKPWFDGKLDFAPPVRDLAAQGYVLVGGRLDYVINRPVAALVYQRRQHSINLFIWPAAEQSDTTERASVRQGYNLIHWTRSGMMFWAVSDLNLAELQEFVRDLQDRQF